MHHGSLSAWRTMSDMTINTVPQLQVDTDRPTVLYDEDGHRIYWLGITEVTADDTQESAVKRADGAMYTAKTTGKNRVVTA